MKELQIAAAQELSKLEGMDKNPWRLVLFADDLFITEEPKNGYGESMGKYLPSSELWNWSSSKILARAGWDASKQTLENWLIDLWGKSNSPRVLPALFEDRLEEIREPLREGNHELAYILSIILLQKIDNEAYLKAMEPLK